MANLRLDGILPHDVSNEKTEELAKPLIENGNMNYTLNCGPGRQFTSGTLRLYFKNPTKTRLTVNVNFFHHHQLQISNSPIQQIIEPGSDQTIEIALKSFRPLEYKAIDLLLFDWKLAYDHPDYKDFSLSGKFQLELKPGQTEPVVAKKGKK